MDSRRDNWGRHLGLTSNWIHKSIGDLKKKKRWFCILWRQTKMRIVHWVDTLVLAVRRWNIHQLFALMSLARVTRHAGNGLKEQPTFPHWNDLQGDYLKLTSVYVFAAKCLEKWGCSKTLISQYNTHWTIRFRTIWYDSILSWKILKAGAVLLISCECYTDLDLAKLYARPNCSTCKSLVYSGKVPDKTQAGLELGSTSTGRYLLQNR